MSAVQNVSGVFSNHQQVVIYPNEVSESILPLLTIEEQSAWENVSSEGALVHYQYHKCIYWIANGARHQVSSLKVDIGSLHKCKY